MLANYTKYGLPYFTYFENMTSFVAVNTTWRLPFWTHINKNLPSSVRERHSTVEPKQSEETSDLAVVLNKEMFLSTATHSLSAVTVDLSDGKPSTCNKLQNYRFVPARLLAYVNVLGSE